eukprot:496619_1
MPKKKVEEEITDDELLAEIAKETLNRETLEQQNVTGDNVNDTINYNQYEGGAQLTTFQDNIITTGSDVSILLMVILLLLFVIQMIRKTYNYFTFQSKIQSVVNPLDDAKPMAAENLTPINPHYDHKSYAVYNTEFEHRKTYLQKQAEGAQPSILKQILLDRAVQCIQKARAMQRDGVGIRKNWNMDLLPRDVWEDFNAAQRNIQAEVECVVRENQRFQFNWGVPHKNNIFSKAKEIHERNMMVQNKAFHQKMQQLKERQTQNQKYNQLNKNKNKNKNKSKAPTAKSFGNGFNTGFFNSNPQSNSQQSSKRLTKKEKQELKRQKKAMKNSNQATMLKDNIENPAKSNSANYQQTQPRRRKPKRRFATK